MPTKHYFIDPADRIAGECLTEEPANLGAFRIAVLDEIPGDCTEYRLVNGAVVHSPPEKPPKTDQEIKAELIKAVQKHLDDTARARAYDNIVSACSYAAAPNPFQAESQAFLVWRADCWMYCCQALDAVQSGARQVPTAQELIAELPQLVLPG